ncbi:hypothetical protein COCVIDRAFT_33286 [Bipolaris victoriae FI3]|uniref:Altered inheritance of mitochondria protein 9, mitochondrial n=1 Tax=Bipolaris victoriae (strain FI3) TaxID=930091 RepID=W7F1T3_BIPV3|nr:hypothetical protein COCVIDRAFT_33286 [Bipolaris victoriae FI3]
MALGRSVSNIAKRHYCRLLHTLEGSRAMPLYPQIDMNPLFCYTSGRWLWNEREQLEARYRPVGANKCISFEKIGEGNYNKAYRLEMEDGQKIIAKVPHPNAGPRILTTASEVATMDATDQNPVQAEYIIMEQARGSQLHETWQGLSLRRKCDIVHTGIAGCEPAVVTSGPQDVIIHVESTYCIGPITRREFWEKQRSEMPHHGPFSEAHKALLEKFLAAIPYITPKDPELASPRLWHPDFHAGNIYVDEEARISCIIEWQGAWTAPVFIGANPPLLLDYGIDMLMKLPENFKALDNATKEKLRYQVSQSVLVHTYETCTAEKNPLMYKVMRHPHGQSLKQLEAFVGSTLDNCLFPFEECLIRQHNEEAGSFNKSQEFWKELQGVLTDEDYTPKESFGKAVKILKDLREVGLGDLKGEERNNFDKETRWVADLDEHNI